MEVVRDVGDKRLEIDVLHMTMWCHIGLKDWAKAIDQMEDAIVLAQEVEDEVDEAAAVHNIAYLTLLKDEKKSAIDKVDEAKSLFAKAEDKKGEASSCMIAAACKSNDDEAELDEAVEQATKARDLFAEAKDLRGEGNACSVLADLYIAQDKAEEALQMAERRAE